MDLYSWQGENHNKVWAKSLCVGGLCEKYAKWEDSYIINGVQVDTIRAGVPGILYVPTSVYAHKSTIPLVMKGFRCY